MALKDDNIKPIYGLPGIKQDFLGSCDIEDDDDTGVADTKTKVEFYKAFLKAQSEFPDISKNKSGNRGFKYADLETILKSVIPVLHKNGIIIEQEITHNEKSEQCILTRLTHAASGQGSEFITLVPFREEDFKGKIAFQVYGAGFTYFKRYALAAKLGLYTDEDNDGFVPNQFAPNQFVPNKFVPNEPVQNQFVPSKPKKDSDFF